MRILILTHTYPSKERPWITPFIASFCEALAGADRNKVFVSMPGVDQLEDNRIKVYPFFLADDNQIPHKEIGSSHHDISIFKKARYFISGTLTALSVARKHRPEVIHAHWCIPSGLIACIVSQFTGIPFVVTTHGRDVLNSPEFGYDIPSSFMLRTATTLVLKRASRVLTTSPITEAAVQQLVPNAHTHLIPVGVELNNFDSSTPVPGRDSILFAGDLIPRKGPHVLLEAIAQSPLLKEQKVIIVGGGSEHDNLIDYARQHKLENVHFPGPLEPLELARHFAQARVLAFPSLIEAFGIVLLEALAAGAAIAGFETGALPALKSDKIFSERIFPAAVGDAAALRAALEAALEYSPAEQRQQIIARLREKYSWEAIAEEHSMVYSEIAKDLS